MWPISFQVTGSVLEVGLQVTVKAVRYVPGTNVSVCAGLAAKPFVAVNALLAFGTDANRLKAVGLV